MPAEIDDDPLLLPLNQIGSLAETRYVSASPRRRLVLIRFSDLVERIRRFVRGEDPGQDAVCSQEARVEVGGLFQLPDQHRRNRMLLSPFALFDFALSALARRPAALSYRATEQHWGSHSSESVF